MTLCERRFESTREGMEFFQTYGKELVSLAVPIITWMLNRVFKARPTSIGEPAWFCFLDTAEDCGKAVQI